MFILSFICSLFLSLFLPFSQQQDTGWTSAGCHGYWKGNVSHDQEGAQKQAMAPPPCNITGLQRKSSLRRHIGRLEEVGVDLRLSLNVSTVCTRLTCTKCTSSREPGYKNNTPTRRPGIPAPSQVWQLDPLAMSRHSCQGVILSHYTDTGQMQRCYSLR